jgi:exodeoxyribonuclease V
MIEIIKGRAGTGKTTKIQQLVQTPYPTVVVAPTNKAVEVLRKRDITAYTIHSALYKSVDTGKTKKKSIPVLNQSNNKPLVDIDGKIVYQEVIEQIYEYQFDINQLRRYTPDLKNVILIIDESSMVPATIWYELHNCGLNVLAIGDDRQLPPIESDYEDLIKAIKNATDGEVKNKLKLRQNHLNKFIGFFEKTAANEELTTVYRQNGNSNILTIADTIETHGYIPFPFSSQDVECVDWDMNNYTFNNSEQMQKLFTYDIVIAFRNDVCQIINSKLRSIKFAKEFETLTEEESRLPRIGDKLYIEAKFATDMGSIINKGTSCIITDVILHDYENNILYIDLITEDNQEFTNVPLSLQFINGKKNKNHEISRMRGSYGYALTCHKTQGSQWANVAVIDECHYHMAKNWRYTAVTRAAKTLYVAKYRSVEKLLKK